MIISAINSRFVKFQPENEREKKLIHSFPGFIKVGLEYFAKAKPHVVSNLVERLRHKKLHLTMDHHVQSLVSNTFRLKAIPEDFKFFTEPLKHQMIALKFAYTVGSFGLLLNPGLGKTKVVLDYVALIGFKKTLVICPKALMFVWVDERDKHRPDKSMYCIKTTDWESERESILKADIIVVNYSKAVILEEQLSSITWNFIAVDEGLITNGQTQQTKSIINLGFKVENKCVMSGTLVSNSPLDIFSPTRFLEPSLTGQSFTKFRDEYAVMAKGGKSAAGNDLKFVVGFRRVEEIRDILHSCSIIMTKEEWLQDLPPKVFKDSIVLMSDEQRKHFEEMSSNFITEVDGEFVEVDNPLTVLCKLLQIANGFIYINPNDPEEQAWVSSGEERKPKKKLPRRVHFFKEQPKAKKLVQLITEELKGRRVIVWFNMSGERTIIEKALTENKISFETIAGGETNTGEKVRRFNRDQSQTVLLCQAQSVNYGITVLGTKTEALEEEGIEVLPDIDTDIYTQIFYSISFSLQRYTQQTDRCHRIGQTRSCEYYHLLSNSTIESSILDRLKEKMEIRDSILIDILNQTRGRLFIQE